MKNAILKIIKMVLIIAVFVIFIPVVLNAIFMILMKIEHLKLKQLSSGDILSFYGVVISVVCSLYVFKEELKKYKKEKYLNSKPKVSIRLKRKSYNKLNFKLTITNCGNKDLVNVSVNEANICSRIIAGCSITKKISFECEKGIKMDYNEEEFDQNIGYPKELLVTCSDFEDNVWGCHYHLSYDGMNSIDYCNYYIEAL